jgi:hypothetical protein
MALAFLDKSGHVIPGSHAAVWTSSNPAVASVDGVGNVRGVALGGPVTITANASGKSVSTSLNVIPASVVFTPIVTTLLVGTSTHLTAVAQDASQLPIAGGSATWSASPSSVATVDSTGVVTALAQGTIAVSATIAGRVGTTQILAGVPSVYDGVWSGPVLSRDPTAPPAATVTFTVIYGTVTSLVLSDVKVGTCGTTSITVVGSQAVSSEQFVLMGQGSAQITDLTGIRLLQGAVTISGAFTDPGAMSGQIAPATVQVLRDQNSAAIVCPNSALGSGVQFNSTLYTATK